MKNVSFGELIVKREIPRLTKHQVKVDDMASDYLESRTPEYNYITSVESEVSENMYSDILMIHKKDGSTEIKLVSDNEKKEKDGVEWFNVDKKDNKPLVINAKESYASIQKKLAKYAEKLKNLSAEYYGRMINDTRFYENIEKKVNAPLVDE